MDHSLSLLASHPIFSTPLTPERFSLQSWNAFGRCRIRVVGDLVRKRPKDLRQTLYFGSQDVVREARVFLHSLHLRLGMTEEEIAVWTPPANLT
jgi:DNA-directed RNA polymerase alpha subunit